MEIANERKAPILFIESISHYDKATLVKARCTDQGLFLEYQTVVKEAEVFQITLHMKANSENVLGKSIRECLYTIRLNGIDDVKFVADNYNYSFIYFAKIVAIHFDGKKYVWGFNDIQDSVDYYLENLLDKARSSDLKIVGDGSKMV